MESLYVVTGDPGRIVSASIGEREVGDETSEGCISVAALETTWQVALEPRTSSRIVLQLGCKKQFRATLGNVSGRARRRASGSADRTLGL